MDVRFKNFTWKGPLTPTRACRQPVGQGPVHLYLFAAVLAAAVHDLHHPGVGNDFRVRTVRKPPFPPLLTPLIRPDSQRPSMLPRLIS